MGFKIEPTIIDGNIEKKGLYSQSKEEQQEEKLESADDFLGVLDTLDLDGEELFSARDIGKAFVPKALTEIKQEARKVDAEQIKSDEKLLQTAQEINDEFKEQANSQMSKLEDLFR